MNEGSKLLKYGLIGLVTVVIVIYSYIQTINLIRGPILLITYPSTNTTFNKSVIDIKGNIKNSSYITMNGRQIFVDEFGKFNEILLLSEGYNIVEVEVIDKFDRKKRETLELIYIDKEKTLKTSTPVIKTIIATSTPSF